MKKRIAIDMDEVMADPYEKLIRLYEEEYGVPIDRDKMPGHYLEDVVHSDHRSSIRRYLFAEDFFEDLRVMPDSQEVMQEMQEHYDIFIVTAAMEFPDSFGPKYRWLQRHFSFIHWKNYVFCGDKSIIKADYMIDDHAKNLETFSGEAIIYTSPHNVFETRFPRVNNWQEVAKRFLPNQ